MKLREHPLALLFACTAAVGAFAASPDDRVQSAWTELALLNSDGALELFRSVPESAASRREIEFGEAVALLNAQPRSEAKLAEARRLFTAVQEQNPDDDTGIAATYYLARLRQIHDYAPDRTAAVLAYRALLAAHPGHPVAELAAPKLALLLLFDDVPATVWEQRVQEISDLLPRLRSPEARRDTRLILADALIQLRRDHARAYPLLVYCLDENLIVRPQRLNTALLQAAESARFLDRTAEAAALYTRYLDQFPRDIKASEIRARLDALPRKGAP